MQWDDLARMMLHHLLEFAESNWQALRDHFAQESPDLTEEELEEFIEDLKRVVRGES